MFQMKKYMSPGTPTFQPRPQPGAMYMSDKLQSPYGSSAMNGGDMVPLSPADPKPRLRWTPELHERFVDAVTQLGGADSNSLPSYQFTHPSHHDQGFTDCTSFLVIVLASEFKRLEYVTVLAQFLWHLVLV